MADLLTGALVGSVVDKLLTKVLEAASLALNHNKYCRELHTLLTRLQPLAVEVSAKAEDGGANSADARNWLQSLCKELEQADEILQDSSKAWKIMRSRKILSVMQRIEKIVQEVGIIGVASAQGTDRKIERMGGEAREYFETLSAQLTSLQQQLDNLELQEAARKAFLTPVCNYGHSVGATSVDVAFAEIKASADSAMCAATTTTSTFEHIRSGAGAAGGKLRRQDSETVFGGAQVVEDMQKVLLSEDEGIRWVGVWATGGAGKTLTAQRLFNSPALQSHFTGGTFWLTVGRDASIHKLLQALSIECTGRSQAGFFSDDDLKNRLCQDLGNRKNVVLFLDDVWSGVCLDWLDVLPAGGMNRIFVTTRNVEVLERKHAVKMQIPMLPVEDSWKLFCWHAFRGADKVLPDLEDVAREVADECKGLPLALKVIGAAFAGKTAPKYWNRSLDKLKKAEVLSQEHEQQLLLRLELSLEELPNLHPRLKDCFLYFAAFPEDAQVRVVEDLLDAWVGEGIVQGGKHTYDTPEDEAFHLLGWLIARSLIELQAPKITSYISQYFLTCKIHDVLRDLARYVLQQKEPHNRDCLYEAGRSLECFPSQWITTDNNSQLSVCRLSLSFNSLTELPQQLKAPKLQVLLLRDNPLKKIPTAFFESFRSLKVLDLRKTLISKLPSTLGHDLKQLVSLNLSSCFNLETIPDSTGEMRGLQRLDLSHCFKLASLPSSLSKLTGLQILNLFMSFKVWDDKEPSPSCTCTVSGLLLAKKRAVLKDVSRLSSLNRLRICSAKIKLFSLNLNSLKKLEETYTTCHMWVSSKV